MFHDQEVRVSRPGGATGRCVFHDQEVRVSRPGGACFTTGRCVPGWSLYMVASMSPCYIIHPTFKGLINSLGPSEEVQQSTSRCFQNLVYKKP